MESMRMPEPRPADDHASAPTAFGSAGVGSGSTGTGEAARGARGEAPTGLRRTLREVEAMEHGAARLADTMRETVERLADTVGERAERPTALAASDPRRPSLPEYVQAAAGIGFLAGLMAGLGAEQHSDRPRPGLWRVMRGASMAAVALGVGAVFRELARPRGRDATRRLRAPDQIVEAPIPVEWLIDPDEAARFPTLAPGEAAARLVSAWERLLLDAPDREDLCAGGDRLVRLALSHPAPLPLDVPRVCALWSTLATLDETAAAQLAWTAARGGYGGVPRERHRTGGSGGEPTTADTNAARASGLALEGLPPGLTLAFVEAVAEHGSGSPPPLSHGRPRPPSATSRQRPRDGRLPPPPPPPDVPQAPSSGPPDPVSFGASAPQSVRPRSRFLAQFAAYVQSKRGEAWNKLTQDAPADAVRMDRERRKQAWPDGIVIAVIPSAPYLTFDPPEVEFVWNGGCEIHDFTCAVDDDAPQGSTVLELGVFARAVTGESIQLDRIRLGIGILDGAPAQAPPATAEHPLPRSIFASYAIEDSNTVLTLLAVAHSLRMDVYEYRLRAQPGLPIRATLEREIRERDMFLLFWSHHARDSPWVTWEIEVALECEKAGRPEIVPYLLRHMEPREFPPRLADRQFLNPFLMMADYGRALEMQRDVVPAPDTSPLSPDAAPRVVDAGKKRRPPDGGGADSQPAVP